MLKDDIKILKDFINNKVSRGKLEMNLRGGFKMGAKYKYTELNPAIDHVLKRLEELEQIEEAHRIENGELRDKLSKE